jgi:hypothetical protein
MSPNGEFERKSRHSRSGGGRAADARTIRLAHSVRGSTPGRGHDLPSVAHLTQSERPADLFAQAAREIDGLKSAIAEALAHTEAPLDHGRIPELRLMMQRLREEAEGVAKLVAQIKAAAEPRSGERRVVQMDEVIDRALEGMPDSTAVARSAQPDLPPVVGHARRLIEMVQALLATGAGPGTLTIDTSAREGALRGEWIVRLRIMDERPPTQPSELDLQTAAAIARDHGGVMSVDPGDERGRILIIDLPAL